MMKTSGYLEAFQDFVDLKVISEHKIIPQGTRNSEGFNMAASNNEKRKVDVVDAQTVKRLCLNQDVESDKSSDDTPVDRTHKCPDNISTNKNPSVKTDNDQENHLLNKKMLTNISNDCCGDSKESVFIPFANATFQSLNSSTTSATDFKEAYNDPSLNGNSLSVRARNGFLGTLSKKSLKPKRYIYKRVPRRKNAKKKAVEKPKVIVEMAPTIGICLSDISALRESDYDSDNVNPSDDSNLLSDDQGLREEEEMLMRESIHEVIPHITKQENGLYADPNTITSAKSEDGHLSLDRQVTQDSTYTLGCDRIMSLDDGLSNSKNICDSNHSNGDLCLDTINEVHISELEVEIDTGSEFALSSISAANATSAAHSQVPRRKKKKRNSILSLHIRPGRGLKFEDIHCLNADIDEAPLDMISLLHIILYDVPGSTSNVELITETKINVLRFSGFPFDETSQEYATKKNRLKRLHFRILEDVAHLLLGGHLVARIPMVNKILHFLMCPTNEEAEELRPKRKVKKIKYMAECSRMKKEILAGKGPRLTLVLNKMTNADLLRYRASASSNHNEKLLSSSRSPSPSPQTESNPIVQPSAAILEKNHKYPAYLNQLIKNSWQKKLQEQSETNGLIIETDDIDLEKFSKDKVVAVMPAVRQPHVTPGPGKLLKAIPEVEERVHQTEERIINLIHTLLFGFPDEIEKAKNSILNFSGFPSAQQHLLYQRQRFLRLILTTELKKICDIFKLPCDEDSKTQTIDNILEFLVEPSDRFIMQKNFEKFSALLCSKPLHKPLSSFENIQFNIQCATPDDLNELHDILYLKPCDTFEIHQRVLQFNGFAFDINSSDYYIRKTLMSYISVLGLRKIAKLLDLPYFAELTHKEQMSTGILKFLTDFKVPEVTITNNDPVQKTKAHIIMIKTVPDESSYNLSSPASPARLSEEDDFRLTEGRSYTDFCTPDISSSEDEADYNMPLTTFASHPTDSQLKKDIQEIMRVNLNNLSMKSLVHCVLARYKHLDLQYRKKFVISTARKILSCLPRSSAINVEGSPEQEVHSTTNPVIHPIHPSNEESSRSDDATRLQAVDHLEKS